MCHHLSAALHQVEMLNSFTFSPSVHFICHCLHICVSVHVIFRLSWLQSKSFSLNMFITLWAPDSLKGHTKLSYFYFLNVLLEWKRSTKLFWLLAKEPFWTSLKEEVVGCDRGERAPDTPIWPQAPTPPAPFSRVLSIWMQTVHSV